MGVKGLESFTNKTFGRGLGCGDKDITQQLAGKVILVDLPALEHHILDSCPDGQFPGIEELDDIFVKHITEFCVNMKRMGIKQVWIDDGCLNAAKTATQKRRDESDIVPSARFNSAVIKSCGSEASTLEIPSSSSFQDYYIRQLFPNLVKDESSRGQSQHVSAQPSMYRIIKQNLLKKLKHDDLIEDIIFTIYEADAYIGMLAKQQRWKGCEIAAVLSQDSDFLIFDVPYFPLQSMRIIPSSDCNPLGSIHGSLLPSGTFSTKMYNIAVKKLGSIVSKVGSGNGAIVAKIRNLCPIERFQLLLADLATIGTNDFYLPEARSEAMPSHVQLHRGSAIASHIERNLLGTGSVPTGASFALYSAGSRSQPGFSDFEGISAFLICCSIAGLVDQRGALDVDNSVLAEILFCRRGGSGGNGGGKTGPQNVSRGIDGGGVQGGGGGGGGSGSGSDGGSTVLTTVSDSSTDVSTVISSRAAEYAAARDQYNLDSPMALNEVPPRLRKSGYYELYTDGRISYHMGRLLALDRPEDRIFADDINNLRFYQFGFPAGNIIQQKQLRLELLLTAGYVEEEEEEEEGGGGGEVGDGTINSIATGAHLCGEKISVRELIRAPGSAGYGLRDKVVDVLVPSKAEMTYKNGHLDGEVEVKLREGEGGDVEGKSCEAGNRGGAGSAVSTSPESILYYQQRNRLEWIAAHGGGFFLFQEEEVRRGMLFEALGGSHLQSVQLSDFFPGAAECAATAGAGAGAGAGAIAGAIAAAVAVREKPTIKAAAGGGGGEVTVESDISSAPSRYVSIDQLHIILLALNTLVKAYNFSEDQDNLLPCSCALPGGENAQPESMLRLSHRLYWPLRALLAGIVDSLCVSEYENDPLSTSQPHDDVIARGTEDSCTAPTMVHTRTKYRPWYKEVEPRASLRVRTQVLGLYLLYADCLDHVLSLNDALGAPLELSHPLLLQRFDCHQAHVNFPHNRSSGSRNTSTTSSSSTSSSSSSSGGSSSSIDCRGELAARVDHLLYLLGGDIPPPTWNEPPVLEEEDGGSTAAVGGRAPREAMLQESEAQAAGKEKGKKSQSRAPQSTARAAVQVSQAKYAGSAEPKHKRNAFAGLDDGDSSDSENSGD